MTIQTAPLPEMQRNFRHLYFDIAWFGLLAASTISFTSVYATRLGANSFQISLLSVGPALVSLFLSLPAGRWLAGRSLIRTTLVTAILQRAGFFILVLLPWLFAAPGQIWAILLITLVSSLPGSLLALSFSATLAQVAPDPYRVDVISRRNAIVAASTMATSLLVGQLLNQPSLPFPGNYQLVFALGALGAGMSTFHLFRLKPITEGPPPVDREAPAPPPAQPKLLRMDLLRGSFGRMMGAFLLFYIFQNFGLPLIPLVNVRVLQLSDWEIGLGTFLFYLLTFLVSLRLSRWSRRFGHRRLLVGGALLLGLYPLFLGLARDATLYWVASVLGGAVWAVLSVSIFNRLLERSSEHDLPAYLAIHLLVQNLGILVGSLLGPAVGEQIGLQTALLVCTVLRLGAGLVLARWG